MGVMAPAVSTLAAPQTALFVVPLPPQTVVPHSLQQPHLHVLCVTSAPASPCVPQLCGVASASACGTPLAACPSRPVLGTGSSQHSQYSSPVHPSALRWKRQL